MLSSSVVDSSPPSPTLEPGTILDRYELLCTIARGGMAHVWLGRFKGKHGFEKLGFDRVIAYVQSPNRASMRVCEKLGLKSESSFQRNGREVAVFSIRKVGG